jgi:hypothetical protein
MADLSSDFSAAGRILAAEPRGGRRIGAVDQAPRTLLEQLVRGSQRTIDEHVELFAATADKHHESAPLSSRQLSRWMTGTVRKARASRRRVAELCWGYPFDVLMGSPDPTPARSTRRTGDALVEDPTAPPRSSGWRGSGAGVGITGGFPLRIEPSRDTDGIDHLAAVLDGQRPVEPHVIDHLRTILVETRHLDDRLGSGDLVEPVNSQLRLVANLIRNARDEDLGQSLWTMAAELSQFLAWLLLDLAQYDRADACYRQGLRAAREAGDADLFSYLLGWLSFVAMYRGEPADALALATSARSRGERSACQALRAWLAAIEARSHAGVGNADASHRALDEAHAEIGRRGGAENPSWLYHFDDVALLGYRGTSLVMLNQSDDGAAAIEQTLSQLDPSFVRARAIYDSLLMSASLTLGNIDAACAYGVSALETAVATGSRRGVLTVRSLRRQLPESHQAAVEYLDERLMLA